MLSKIITYWQTEKHQKILFTILIVIVFGIIFVLNIFPIEDVDTWLHLKFGEQIVETKSLPKVDFFSYTVTGTKDYNHEWLAQIIFYLVYRSFGFDGLILFKALIIMTSFAILLRTAYLLWGRSFLSVFVLVSMSMISAFRFIERPDLFTFLFLSILIYLIFTYKIAKNDYKILFLPLVFLFWVNTHGLFIIGWGVIGLIFTMQIIFYFLQKKYCWFEKFTFTKKKLFLFLVATLLSFLICLVNPYGFKLIVVIFQGIFGLTKFFAEINEWKSPFDPMHQPREYVSMFVVSGSLLMLLFLLNFRNFQPLFFIMFIFFFSSCFKGMRNISFYAIGIYLPLVYNLKQFFLSFKYTNFQKRFFYPFFQAFLIMIFFIFYLSLIFKGNSLGLNYHHFNLGVNEAAFPIKAVDFLDNANIQGNMLNQYDLGCYLIWRSFPERKVFIDGRTGLYGDKFYFRYKNFASSQEELKKATAQYNFNYIILIDSHFLQNNPDWQLVYFDDLFRIYLKNDASNKKIIDQYGFKYLDPNLNLDDLMNKYQDINFEELKNELLRALSQNYQSITVHSLLSDLYYLNGEKEKSWQQLKMAKEVMPNLPQTYLAIGNYYAREKEFKLAEKNYKKALSLHYQFAQVYHNLGNVYLEQKKYQQAFKNYQKAIYLDKNFALSYLGLGEIYDQYLHEPQKAITSFETYLKINPKAKEKNEIENKINVLKNNLAI